MDMTLRILLPFRVFTVQQAVTHIIAETRQGAFGILPRRLDCAAALVPGILIYETAAAGEQYVALDEGVLVKTGPNVTVSVRNAIEGIDLRHLRDAVEREFLTLDDQERSLRSTLARLEGSFVRRLSEFRHE